jgi:hypothetical protein
MCKLAIAPFPHKWGKVPKADGGMRNTIDNAINQEVFITTPKSKKAFIKRLIPVTSY